MKTTKTAFLILILIFGHAKTFGCDCRRATTDQYFKHAEVVFTGRVLKIIKKTNFWSSFEYVDKNSKPKEIILTQIEITEIFKGLNPKLKFVSIPTDYSSCQYNFTEGDEYLIFANEIISNPGIIMTWYCSGNHVISDKLGDEFKLLRKLKDELKPFEPSDNYDFTKSKTPYVIQENDYWTWAKIALIISVLINLGLIIYFKLKRS